jgi:hypothetical protein
MAAALMWILMYQEGPDEEGGSPHEHHCLMADASMWLLMDEEDDLALWLQVTKR